MSRKFDIQKELSRALKLDSDNTIYDGCVREANGKLYIDGVVYEFVNGHYGYGATYDALDDVLLRWAEANGGEYYEAETPSVLVVAH